MAADLPEQSAGQVSLRMLHSAADTATAERLFIRVWGGGDTPLGSATMRALAHTGNYVAGAFVGAELVGCAVGFFGPPDERSLHSDITGVDPRQAGRGIGTMLKNHQRDWCLERGVATITWTYDPAIARNAHFNLAKLGVAVVGYVEDFYGPMDDGLNVGSPSDRLLVRWDLTRPPPAPDSQSLDPAGRVFALAADDAGSPVVRDVAGADAVLVQVPGDIERLRREDPPRAARWRLALREVLSPYLADGTWRVTGFTQQGCYVVEKQVVESRVAERGVVQRQKQIVERSG